MPLTLKNFYKQGRPGANTLLYLPLNSTDTYTDKSGHITYSNTGVTFGTYQGVDCAIFNGSSYLNGDNITFGNKTTILGWSYFDTSGLSSNFYANIDMRASGSNVYFMGYSTNTSYHGYFNWSFDDIHTNNYTYNGQRIFFAMTLGDGVYKWYLKGNNIDVLNTYSKINDGFTTTINRIGRHDNVYFKGGMSGIIIENKTWTDQEIADYFNQTKSLYGIS